MRGGKGRALTGAAAMTVPQTDYFSAVWTEVNVVFRLEPRLATTVMIATEMPAAISPYSMAVAPFSSRKKRKIVDMLNSSLV